MSHFQNERIEENVTVWLPAGCDERCLMWPLVLHFAVRFWQSASGRMQVRASATLPPSTASNLRLHGDLAGIVALEVQVPRCRLRLGVAGQQLHCAPGYCAASRSSLRQALLSKVFTSSSVVWAKSRYHWPTEKKGTGVSRHIS